MYSDLLVTGSGGLLGYALRQTCPDAIFVTRKDFDLRDLHRVREMFETLKPKRVIHLAAVVGGVKMNEARNADLFEENVQINTNVLQTARRFGVSRLISILSNCAFPFFPDRPSTEDVLHTGLPFKGNLGYGYAKRMLDMQTKLLWEQYGSRYSTITPVNLYGPNDNWDLERSHVIASLIHKCFLAKQEHKALEVWGSGKAVRQFIFSGDIARVLVQELDSFHDPETVIVVPDLDITIADLARMIARVMSFEGPIVFNSSKLEGQVLKVMKSKRFSDRFPSFVFTSLEDGLKTTVEWFYRHYPVVRMDTISLLRS